MIDVESDLGFISYFGGLSPVGVGSGFHIDVIEMSDDPKSDHPYAARLMYGAYEYVKEEF